MNTKQAQQRAKLKRQQQALAKKHDAFFTNEKTMWAKYGVFNTRHEMEGSANVERARKNKPIYPLGEHWKFWTQEDRDLIAYDREIILSDNQGITDIIYDTDNITFTLHTLEQMYVRGGFSIEKNYQRNLGLDSNLLKTYLSNMYHSFEKVLGETAVRSDIILPFRGGALLGNVRLGEDFHIQRQRGQYYLVPKPMTKVFRAETWITKSMLRRDQSAVCDAWLAGDIDQAVKLMKSMEAFIYEGVDYQALKKLMDKTMEDLPVLAKLV